MKTTYTFIDFINDCKKFTQKRNFNQFIKKLKRELEDKKDGYIEKTLKKLKKNINYLHKKMPYCETALTIVINSKDDKLAGEVLSIYTLSEYELLFTTTQILNLIEKGHPSVLTNLARKYRRSTRAKSILNHKYDSKNGETALFSSASHNDVQMVKDLLKAGVDLNSKNKYGETPLHIAAENNHISVVNVLLKYLPLIDEYDVLGRTPLHVAAANNNLDVVNALLQAGANIKRSSKALYTAAAKNNLDMVNALLQAGANITGANINGSFNALYAAAANNNVGVVNVLLEAGAKDYLKPLNIACAKGHLGVVKVLLKWVRAHDWDYYEEPLFNAAKNGKSKIVQALVKTGHRTKWANQNNNQTPLYISVLNEDLEVVEILLKNHAYTEHTAAEKDTLLSVAAQKENAEIFKALHKEFTKTECMTEESMGAHLLTAFKKKNIPLIEYLLNTNADKEHCSLLGESPLHLAAYIGDINIVTALIRARVNINAKDNYGASSLHIAAKWGHPDVVKALLKAGANKDFIATNGATPLYSAVLNSHLDVVKVLLDAKANIDIANIDGQTPLFIAVLDRKVKIVEALLKAGADPNKATTETNKTPLYIAARDGHLDEVNALLDAHVDIDIDRANIDGRTPLYIAALNHHLDVVNALLGAGANKELAANDGATPLYIAAQEGYRDVVKALIKKIANLNHTTPDGASPLIIAIHNGHLNVADALINLGANINQARTVDNMTPLWVAANKGDLNCVLSLLRAGADVNKATVNGKSPLYIATVKGHINIVEALLAAGADINKAHINTKKTPLLIAADKGYLQIVKSLLAFNADINILDNQDRSPLYYASNYRNNSEDKHSYAKITTILMKHPDATLENLRQSLLNQTQLIEVLNARLDIANQNEEVGPIYSNWPRCYKTNMPIVGKPVKGADNELYDQDNYNDVMIERKLTVKPPIDQEYHKNIDSHKEHMDNFYKKQMTPEWQTECLKLKKEILHKYSSLTRAIKHQVSGQLFFNINNSEDTINRDVKRAII